jgi:hypothetical protein
MKLVLGLLILGVVSQTHAADYDHRPDVERITRSIDMGGLTDEMQTAIDSLVTTGTEEMRARGAVIVADRIAGEWQRYFRRWDLGDHAPLIPMLRNTYLQMEKVLGKARMKKLHLTDIHIINHALPVVLNPKGRDWDRVEYRKHFVPFAGVLTYWGIYLACRYFVDQSSLVKICKPAAGAGRWWMTTSLAPRLSDRVYRQFVRNAAF